MGPLYNNSPQALQALVWVLSNPEAPGYEVWVPINNSKLIGHGRFGPFLILSCLEKIHLWTKNPSKKNLKPSLIIYK